MEAQRQALQKDDLQRMCKSWRQKAELQTDSRKKLEVTDFHTDGQGKNYIFYADEQGKSVKYI